MERLSVREKQRIAKGAPFWWLREERRLCAACSIRLTIDGRAQFDRSYRTVASWDSEVGVFPEGVSVD
jgi:hypothetical protein